jgi:ketosteroid isomerase-like protein
VTTAPASSTEVVVDRHLQCFGTCDVAGILADYAPDAVMISQQGVVRGLDGLRAMFQEVFKEFAPGTTSFEMKTKTIEGDVAYIVWSAETANNVWEFGTDTFVIRDGKIVAQTFSGTTRPKA